MSKEQPYVSSIWIYVIAQNTWMVDKKNGLKLSWNDLCDVNKYYEKLRKGSIREFIFMCTWQINQNEKQSLAPKSLVFGPFHVSSVHSVLYRFT